MELETLQLMARYNIWATQRLNNACSAVTDQDFHRDCGLHFGSIFGTLNHLLLGEHFLWFERFAHGQSPQLALNHIIETERQALMKSLELRSHCWLDFLAVLEPKQLAGNLHYRTASGQPMSLPYASTLMHVFNHGTHHRGQITAALTVMGYACPELDLVYMLCEEQKNCTCQ